MTTYPFNLTQSDVDSATTEYLAQDEATLRTALWPAYSTVFQEGAMAGQNPVETIERWVQDTILPALRSARHQNRESAQRIMAVVEDQQAELTSGIIGLTAAYLVDLLELPEPNERKMVIGLAALALLVARRAQRTPSA